MLHVGLTGGIGSGKSTVARGLVARGAVLVDADALSREVVEPGTEGLAEIVATFGQGVLAADGGLDRPALASLVFGDDAARGRLNAIVHPRVRARSDELIAAAPAGAVVVQDVPLLVEAGMAARFALVVVVHAEVEVRVGRLVEHRGMPEADARARIAVQAADAARRAVADVWLDNSGSPEELDTAVGALWTDRLVPFEANVRTGRPAALPDGVWVPADPGWAADGRRLAARAAAAVGERGRGVAHIGDTAVPGRPAQDVIELQVGTAGNEDLRKLLADAGFPWSKPHAHRSADPGRPAVLHVRDVGSQEWRAALLRRDWLRDHPEKRDVDTAVAEEWAASAGWVPSLD